MNVTSLELKGEIDCVFYEFAANINVFDVLISIVTLLTLLNINQCIKKIKLQTVVTLKVFSCTDWNVTL